MSRRRGCLVVLASAAAVLLVAAVAVYRALDPEALRTLAERQATRLLGAPVTIGRMRVSIVPVLAVTGTDVRIGSAGTDSAPAVSVRAIRLLPQWRTLVSKPIVVDALELDGLSVVLRRDRERRWVLPVPATAAPSADGAAADGVPGLPGGLASESVAVRRVRVRDGRLVVVDDERRAAEGQAEVAVIHDIDADLVQRAEATAALSMRAALGSSPLTGSMEMSPQGLSASMHLPSIRNDDLPAFFALLGSSAPGLTIAGDAPLDVTMHVARDTRALTATGQLGAARVQFDTVSVTDLAAPFRVEQNVLAIEPLTFSAYGGTGRGTLAVRYGRDPATWSLDGRVEGVDIDAFLSANTEVRDRLLARGRIVARLQGTAETPLARHVRGTLDIVLSNGTIRNFALLAAVNRALHLTGGTASDMQFERLSATLELAQGVMRTDNLSLVAGDLTATAQGTIGADGTIEMTGTALFSREASARMIAAVREISGARNARGEVEVPFGISGSVDQPAFSIDAEKILGRAIRKEIERNIRKGLERLLPKP